MTAQLDLSAFDALPPEEIVRRALAELSAPACFTCSFQAEDMAVLHLLRQVQPDIPVLFLETGYHFPETLSYRDRFAAKWNLNLRNLQASMSVAQQESQFGILNQTDPTRCCDLRKVGPLWEGLRGYQTWFTGLRREQSPTRANMKMAERHVLPTGEELVKVNPIAAWKWNEVWAYLSIHEIEALPLYDQGYTSIGCAPCTAKPTGDDLRSGRWGGRKLECGIHTFTEARQ
ncbi:MAG: phosphoadenylyl-sulfate reductase [Bryobacterales bacterium]|jgi:phosphoadenosine phosphosulfate reductase|nr:phosphoadenylyl-sulfate reductase [Bryobacterales bacterium]